MRTRTAWSGVFHCAYCQIEERFTNEMQLCCAECGELMTPGPLLRHEELATALQDLRSPGAPAGAEVSDADTGQSTGHVTDLQPVHASGSPKD